jgi:hypothetical protein
MPGLNVPLPKPTILQPGEEERQLVQGFQTESEALPTRLEPIKQQMGQLETEMGAIQRPPTPELAEVPQFQPRQVDSGEMMAFATIATAFAALGARATRTGITGALTAAGSALKGFNEGNIQQAKIDAENFNTQMRATLAENNRRLSEYEAVVNDRKLTLAQKMQQYSVLAHKYSDEIAMAGVKKQDLRFLMDRHQKERHAEQQVELVYTRMQGTIAAALARIEGQQEPLIPVQMPDGRVVYKKRSEAEGGTVPPRNVGDKLTETEAKGTLFWRQMSSAEEAARGIAGPTFDVANIGSQVGMRMANSDWTNWLAPDKAQQYAQAAEQWAEAYLRLKTGAATNADEIKRNARAYFPQPGDQPAVILQKNQMRAKAIEDVSIIAGRGVDKQPAGGGGGADAQVRQLLQGAGKPYEPEKFEYRVLNGQVQRRPRGR